ncbi:ras-interacting protein 1-like, partial [Passerculus sandwichensis]
FSPSSTSSDTPSRASDPSDPRPVSSSAAPPPKAKPPRHKRLSHLFHRATNATSITSAGHPHSRWASEKKLSDLRDAPSALLGAGVSPSPPCILKIFGGAISRGANYKSVLATPRCSARALVREALERYGLNPEDFGQFALCDVVGRPGGPGGAWQGEHLREVGDAERPLLLQELWKPKAGWSRRFEIRRRQDLDRDRDRDLDRDSNGDGGEGGDGTGLPPPSRRLHRNRSRAASGGPAPPARDPRAGGDAPGPSMRRSISDMNLSTRRRQRKALSVAGGGDSAGPAPAGPPPAPGTPAPNDGDGDGDGGPSLELLAQCLIQPPRDRPYFLLLRGYGKEGVRQGGERKTQEFNPKRDQSEPPNPGKPPQKKSPFLPACPYFPLLRGYGKEDFVLFIMTRPQHIFGRLDRRSGLGATPNPPDPSPEPPEPPQAPPPQKPDPGPFSVVDTFLDAPDLLPRHCLVQADPSPALPAACDPSPNSRDPPAATVRPFRGAAATLNGAPLFRRAPLRPGDLLGLGEHVLLLYKDPRLGEGSRPPWAPPPRPPMGILGVLGCAGCGRSPRQRREELRAALRSPRAELRYRPQDEAALLRDILSMGPGGAEDFGGPEGDSGGPEEDLGALAPAFLLGLCLEHAAKEFPAGHFPELLGRVAGMLRETVWAHLAHLEAQLDIEVLAFLGPCPELEKDLESCDEALGVLDEVIMSTFQQSVYYLTKTLYSALPALLDTNPFVGVAEPRAGPDLGGVPAGLRPPLAVFRAVLGLTRECRLHPDLASQTFGYLFFFSNASLFNTLMEKGEIGVKSRGFGKIWAKFGRNLGEIWGIWGEFLWDLGRPRPWGTCSSSATPPSSTPSWRKTFGYLFFFSNASLFNTLMEKGSAGPFFQWWVGVRLRTNLDLVLDGLGALGLGDIAGDFFRKLSATANLLCTPRGCLEQGVSGTDTPGASQTHLGTHLGLGDIAGDFFRKLSATANLLCTPRGCLEQATWARLRAEFPALSPAQLHHVLRHYRLGRGRAAPPAWSPTPEESTAAATGDIFESFSDHPPLLLPTRGFRLRPGVPLGPGGLLRPLLKIRRRLWELEGGDDP